MKTTRIMAFADIHNRYTRFQPDKLPEADMAIVAGEIEAILGDIIG